MASASVVDKDRIGEISQILLTARRNAGSLPGFPGALPTSLAEAYAVQDKSRADWGQEVAGWKVGGIPPAQAEVLGAKFLAGPIFAPSVVHADGDQVYKMPIFADGGAAIEPEFVLQFGKTRDDDRVFIGVEIASSPIVGINKIGSLAVICDFGNNRGLLVGPEIANWRERFETPMTVIAHIDDEEVGNRVVESPMDGVAAARDFLLEHARSEGIDLAPGTYVSTGAITGIHDAVLGARSTLDFSDAGALRIELVAIAPEG